MPSIYDWSTTPANNGTADPGAAFPEGQAPSTVNDAMRGVEARIAAFIDDLGGVVTVTGTVNTIVLTTATGFMTYADGQILVFKASGTNTGAATVNVNTIGASPLRKVVTSGAVDLSAGDLLSGGRYLVQYDAVAAAWILVNGAGGASSGTDEDTTALIVALAS